MRVELRAPFPWYGGKSRVAAEVWRLLGADCGRYVEPFAGSLGVLLGRPGGAPDRGLEVVNDVDGYVVNVWRALKHAPDETIGWADGLRSELDLTARRKWLMTEGAGWWLYGISMWIGSGFTTSRAWQLPHLGSDGRGVHVSGGVHEVARNLSARLARVLVTNGDWQRVLTPVALRASGGHTAVFLDPPYPGHDEYPDADRVWADVTAWCETCDPRLHVVLCGYAGDWMPPTGWQEIPYTARGTSSGNRTRERLYASPACNQTSLFDAGEAP